MRDLVIFEGILRLERRSISTSNVFHNVFVFQIHPHGGRFHLEFMSDLNCSQFALPKSLIFLFGCIGRPKGIGISWKTIS